MTDIKLKKHVTSAFKISGFSLRSDASSFLVNQLEPLEDDERKQWIDRITENIQKQTLSSPIIDKDTIKSSIESCCLSDVTSREPVISIISAFEIPRFVYNVDRNKFLLDEGKPPELIGSASDKAKLFIERYTLLYQRVSRHKLFTSSAVENLSFENEVDSNSQKYKLVRIESLLCTSEKVPHVVVLGLLTQLKEGKFFLEDPSGNIQIDLSAASYHAGIHTENSMLLAEGYYEDGILHVTGLGQPPAEQSKITREYLGSVNTFGGDSKTSLKLSPDLLNLERDNLDGMIVFLSDVWLDRLKTMQKLEAMFDGYSEFPPIAFVFMGNFLSSQLGSKHCSELRSHFKALGELIARYPSIKEKSKLIFIPGPLDPAGPKILPRPPLSKLVTQELLKKVPNAIMATNPCRLQYCTQEIVLIREDIITKLCRNTIHFPTEGNITAHFARTIISQSTLAPLSLTVCPVYWPWHSALQLYPTPDLVVIGDKFKSFAEKYVDCQVINPSSFPTSDFSFKAYVPATKAVEDCQIPEKES